MRALVLGCWRPASAASEAVSWYVLFVMSKNHRLKRFLRSWLKSKLAQRPRIKRPGELRSDLRGHLRPKVAKIVILQFERWSHLHTWRPTLNSEAVRGHVLKSDLWGHSRPRKGWGVSGPGAGVWGEERRGIGGSTPLLHSNFQSWQMRSLPTLDPYRIFLNSCYAVQRSSFNLTNFFET